MTDGAGFGVDGRAPGKIGHAGITARIPGRGAPDPNSRHETRNHKPRPKDDKPPHSFIPRSRNEFPMTETDDRLIAAAAIIGDSSTPKNGNRIPAATGTPAEL